MTALSDFLEKKLLDHTLLGTTYTPPANVYVALYTTATTDAGGGTEVSGGNYARQIVTFEEATSPGGMCQNSANVVFPTATAAWGMITHVALRDAVSGGNLLFHEALTEPYPINIGDTFKLLAGEIKATLA
jgi:hypothetical protein